ncbi:MAG TPA: hypothetical protein VF529_19215 [Solirubrobacteraceae bacterium]
MIQVRDSFFLDEVRERDTWERVRGSLTEDGVLGDEEHYELFLNPYASVQGSHSLLVTTRTTTEDPAGRPRGKRERHPLTEWQSAFPGTWLLMRLGARFFPRLIAGRFEWLLERMCDDGYADPSYKVFN